MREPSCIGHKSVNGRLVVCPVGVVNHGRLCGNWKTSVNNFGEVLSIIGILEEIRNKDIKKSVFSSKTFADAMVLVLIQSIKCP